ncbi:MAG: putative esterase [Ferruginibacter sp.]|nr:putative esterase [Ferruginibacter sp.]
MNKYLLSLLLLFAFHQCEAKQPLVDTVNIRSKLMQQDFKCVVIKPDNYKHRKMRFPVVYLLHGYSGKYSDWVKKMNDIQIYASLYNLIIVCPDGGFSSWYTDSPVDSSFRYESYIIDEIVPFIDAHFRTMTGSKNRGITGLSMGGHGATMLALHHPAIFGAAASMSGAVDLKEVVNRFDASLRLGDTTTNRKYWNYYSVLKIADTLQNGRISLLIDCGTRDIFIKGNRALHEKLLARNINHDYVERTGEHNWAYWTNALPFHLQFFRKFFDERK